jgi:hypothetical protein
MIRIWLIRLFLLRIEFNKKKTQNVERLFRSYWKLIANLWTGTRTKDSLNWLTCYNAQATTIVLVNNRTLVLGESRRAREVNNQAWIIDEAHICAKIAFSLFLFSFSIAQTPLQWRAAHVPWISLIPCASLSTIYSPHAIRTCSIAKLIMK